MHSSLPLVPTFIPSACSYIQPFHLFPHSSFLLYPTFIPSTCSCIHPFCFFLHSSLPLVPILIPSMCSYSHPFHLLLLSTLLTYPYCHTSCAFLLSSLPFVLGLSFLCMHVLPHIASIQIRSFKPILSFLSYNLWSYSFCLFQNPRALICKHLRRPEIDYKESIPPAFVD